MRSSHIVMSSRSSIAALCLSLLAHALLIVAATQWLAQSHAPPSPPENVLVVALKFPQALPTAPAPPSFTLPSAQPMPTPKPARKEKEKRKPRRNAKPAAPASAPPPIAPHPQPPMPQESRSPLTAQTPSAPAAHSFPSGSAPVPAPPARTGVSIPASYAAANRPPDYPALSRRYGEQGTVVLKVLVKADGTAGTVEISKSSGYPLLDAAARNTVQSWRFNPATSDGKPVAEWYPLPITFTLRE